MSSTPLLPYYEPLAIVGIGCRVPRASGPAALWNLLRSGTDIVGEVPHSRWDIDTFYDPDPLAPGKSVGKWGGYLEQVDGFDWRAFGISPREAKQMDPQHRLLLEVAWEALEDAGAPLESVMGVRAAVVVGIMTDDYSRLNTDTVAIDGYTVPSNTAAFAANRLSYFFDLRGPSFAVDATCASSGLAIHLACRSIWTRDAEMALVGGVNLMLKPNADISMTKANGLSPTGRCRTFDAKADGFVRGEGGIVAVLKPLSHARQDGDRVYAIIMGTGASHTGRGPWIMSPNARSQEEAIRSALWMAQVDGSAIDYVELHGTGTLVGDPIEAQALGATVGLGRRGDERCRVGSVKTNLGHLDAAAGLAGLVKTALSLYHNELPPSLHFDTCNPAIDLPGLGLAIQTGLTPWPARGTRRLAGVQCVGFGGANTHIIVESADRPVDPTLQPRATGRPFVLPLSARTPAALEALARSYVDYLPAAGGAQLSPADLCYTAGARRSHHDYRMAVVGRSLEELRAALAAHLKGDAQAPVTVGRRFRDHPAKVVFAFPGQGPQAVGMAGALLRDEPAFREVVALCDKEGLRHLGWSILEELQADADHARLTQPVVIEPLLFSVYMGLAALWQSWGIKPDAVVGQSFGELAAACVAGALSLEDAMLVVCERGKLTQRLVGQGDVAAVELPVEAVTALLQDYDGKLSIAGVNTPASTLLSGDLPQLEAFLARMEAQGVHCRRVNANYASHSHHMDAIVDEFAANIDKIVPWRTPITLCSTVDGRLHDGAACNPQYWARNLREPVRLMDALETLGTSPVIFIEMSPHPVLLTHVQQVLGDKQPQLTLLPSLRRREEDSTTLRTSLARLYAAGHDVPWGKSQPGRLIHAPTYPWQRTRMWVDPPLGDVRAPAPAAQHPLLGKHIELGGTRAHAWECTISTDQLGYANDHTVQGRPVVPGSAYIEMMAQGGRTLWGDVPLELTQVMFKRALFLPDIEGRRLQMMLTGLEGDDWSARIYSRHSNASGWELHASAVLRQGSATPAVALPAPEALAARLPDSRSGADCYVETEARGVAFGPSFRSIQTLWSGGGELLAKVVLPAGLEGKHYLFHPAAQDACLHPIALLHKGEQRGFMPVVFERMVLHKPPTANMWTYAKERPGSTDPSECVMDMAVTSDAGVPILTIEGCHLRYLDPKAATDVRDLDYYFELGWERLPAPATPPAHSAGTWVILEDSTGVGAALARTLKAQGHTAVCVSHGASSAGDALRADPANLKQVTEVFDAVASRHGTITGVVSLWSLDAPALDTVPLDALGALDTCTSLGAMHVLQALEGRTQAVAPRVWLVTRGAQKLSGDAHPIAVAQATLWGFARSVTQELPHLWGGIVDIDPTSQADIAAAQVWQVVRQGPTDEQIACRDGSLHGLRLVRTPLTEARPPLSLRADACYMVTGGLGGLGLEVARWLCERGARHLLLMGRTELPARAAWADLSRAEDRLGRQLRVLLALEVTGVKVEVATFDLSHAAKLADLIAVREREQLPRVRGVVHAAGLAQFVDLTAMSDADLQQMLGPKVHGAVTLQRLLGRDLDFFINFSSIAAVIQSPRLAHYAAANAFLDALARHRRDVGQHGLSINWGLWDKVGLIERMENNAGKVRGMVAMPPEVGIRILESLLVQDRTHVVVWSADLKEWGQAYPAFMQSPMLAHLWAATGGAPAGDGGSESIRRMLMDAPLGEHPALLLRYVRTKVSAALKNDIVDDANLVANGIDSLLAIELKGRIKADLGIELPLARLLGDGTPNKLATFLAAELGRARPQEGGAPLPAGERRAVARSAFTQRMPLSEAQQALAQIDTLSVQQLDAIIRRLTAVAP